MGDIDQESGAGGVRDQGRGLFSIFIRMIRKDLIKKGDLCKERRDAPSRYVGERLSGKGNSKQRF